jgi:uncharacterized alpha-E superfamily protein
MLSRVADSVYWMARYIERAENVARYVDVSLEASLDNPSNPGKQWMPLLAAAGDQAIFVEKYGEAMAARDHGTAIMRFLAFDPEYPNSIVSCVTKARENARQVRGSLALEAWEHLNKFYHYLNSSEARRRAVESPHDFFSEIRTASYLFEGIVESTMSRGEEYNFLKLGRFLERADQTSRILDVKYFILLPTPSDVGSVVDDLLWAALLHSVSGYEMFRKRHGRIVPERVVDFLVLDRQFPRAILYCLERAEECLLNLSGTPMGSFRNNAEKNVARLRANLAYTNVEEVINQGLHEFLDEFQNGLGQVGEGILETFFSMDTQNTQYQYQQ